jgi:hypothetical protein
MQTKAKANSVITHAMEGDVITFKVKDAGEVGLDLTKLHEAIVKRAAVHGMIQRISDAAAISRDAETGQSATPKEKLAAMSALIDHYHSGTEEWRRTGTGEGGGKSLTIEAIAEVKGISYEAAEAEVVKFAEKRNESTKAILAFLRKGEKVMRAMEAIRARRQGAPKVDADEALQEMRAE